ncbi:uncharacterized protein [Blastocystis hominis]|uniref:Uncharacterized protein n=1 Tax=Blastocystis hominis TaxID=12968 RepID=D8M892_BLAHO|nr:uncharacterized protein [Blastocystis hominis]CBK24281.2 unnamed protein product [Blastocystis hominis]|eukprot:XP_012898329.1 uncharacterized protein [Blastocystis hominis]
MQNHFFPNLKRDNMAETPNNKCVIVGDGAVGKTCLLISYSTDQFPTDYIPTIFDNYRVELYVGNKTTSLELWDTSGQEGYDQLRPLSYSGTDIFLIAFSCVDRISFENVRKWYKELTTYWTDETRDVPIILVATKKDLLTDEEIMKKTAVDSKCVVSLDEMEQMAKEIHAANVIQCSAKTLENVKAVFDIAVNSNR